MNGYRLCFAALSLGLLLVFAGLSRAQDAAPTEPAIAEAAAPQSTEAISTGRQPTFKELFETSPYINTIILVMSVIAGVTFLYLMMAVTTRGFSPPRLVDNVTKLVINRQFDQAIHLCQNSGSAFVSSIFQRVIENREKDHALLMEIITVEGRRRAEPIWNRVNLLAEIANIGPMLGLLGTVFGMIKVFFTMTEDVAGRRASELAGGIGEAMGTTLFGLIVAIAAGMFYTVLRSRVTGVLAEAELACHTLADHVARTAVDPRLKKIDQLADAARQKIALAAATRTTPGTAPATRPMQP